MVDFYKENAATDANASKLFYYTRYEFQFSGLECRVLGSFYRDDAGRTRLALTWTTSTVRTTTPFTGLRVAYLSTSSTSETANPFLAALETSASDRFGTLHLYVILRAARFRSMFRHSTIYSLSGNSRARSSVFGGATT